MGRQELSTVQLLRVTHVPVSKSNKPTCSLSWTSPNHSLCSHPLAYLEWRNHAFTFPQENLETRLCSTKILAQAWCRGSIDDTGNRSLSLGCVAVGSFLKEVLPSDADGENLSFFQCQNQRQEKELFSRTRTKSEVCVYQWANTRTNGIQWVQLAPYDYTTHATPPSNLTAKAWGEDSNPKEILHPATKRNSYGSACLPNTECLQERKADERDATSSGLLLCCLPLQTVLVPPFIPKIILSFSFSLRGSPDHAPLWFSVDFSRCC